MKAKNNISKIKTVFFGTPDFAANCLEYLLDHGVEVVAVVTQPDRPQGRNLQTLPSAVKSLILKKALKIPIFQPEKASNPEFLEEIAKLSADLYIVVVFGQILPQKLLDLPPLGCINVHPSLLPKFRGAAPIRRALMEGEVETGVSIQKMVRQMDAGDVLAVSKLPIEADMTHGELEDKLLNLSKPLLLGVIHQFEKGAPKGEAQDPEKVTYAAKLTPEESEIDWTLPAQKIHNKIRGLSPKPGAWSFFQNGKEKKRVKILRSTLASGKGHPGELLSPNGVIACGEGALQLLEVQPEGKKAMNAADWIRGLSKSSQLFIIN